MDIDFKKLPADERKRMAREKVREILVIFDIDIVPVLTQSPGSLSAQILWIDIQDEKLLQQLGLSKKEPPKTESGEKLIN